MTEKLRKELYENAKRCCQILNANKPAGNYTVILDNEYDELMLLIDEILCGLSGDESEVYWE